MVQYPEGVRYRKAKVDFVAWFGLGSSSSWSPIMSKHEARSNVNWGKREPAVTVLLPISSMSTDGFLAFKTLPPRTITEFGKTWFPVRIRKVFSSFCQSGKIIDGRRQKDSASYARVPRQGMSSRRPGHRLAACPCQRRCAFFAVETTAAAATWAMFQDCLDSIPGRTQAATILFKLIPLLEWPFSLQSSEWVMLW